MLYNFRAAVGRRPLCANTVCCNSPHLNKIVKAEYINLKSVKLFPFQFQLLGVVFLLVGIVFIPNAPYLGLFLIIIGAFILTGYSGIQFDRSTKLYRTYNSFLFLKFGKWKEYGEIEKIFVNSVKVSQKIYTRITEGTTYRNVEYNAYLKLGDGTKEFLTSSKDKKTLFAKLARVGEFFHLEIIDNTG